MWGHREPGSGPFVPHIGAPQVLEGDTPVPQAGRAGAGRIGTAPNRITESLFTRLSFFLRAQQL